MDFKELIETRIDSLWFTAMRLTRNREDAEDLVQESCLKAFENFEALRSESKAKAWLFRILTPELLDRITGTKGRGGGIFKGLRRRLAVAASVALIVMAGYVVTIDRGGSPLIGQMVSDHIQFIPSPDVQVSSSDPAEIKAWFRGKVDFAVSVPRLTATLRGGRLCYLDGKRLALVFYRQDDVQISLFVTDSRDVHKTRTGREVTVKGKTMQRVADRGYNMLLWREDGLTYALVSELKFEEMEKLL